MEERRASWLSRLFRRMLVGIYKRHGWRAHGVVPEPRKFVLIAAPHTSNWDFVYFLGLTDELGIQPHFMAKTSLSDGHSQISCSTWAVFPLTVLPAKTMSSR